MPEPESPSPAAPEPGGSGADAEFDPFGEVFLADGKLDHEFVRSNVHVLIAMLRRSPDCYGIRLDFEQLAAEIATPAGDDLRGAKTEDAFELAAQAFSRERLHVLVTEEIFNDTQNALRKLAADTNLGRRRRLGAGIGLGLLGGLPDERGLRGRGLFDIVLRVTLEELNAQEGLRRRAADSPDGLTPAELAAFWDQYPALRDHYERRYRRDVEAVLEAIEKDRLPVAVSVDLALRGAFTLLREMRLRREGGVALEADECHRLLRDCYDQDFLDGGLETILERWTAGIAAAQRGEGDGTPEEQARTAQDGARALRIVGTGGPGGDVIVFSSYVRAVVEGSFFVSDADEARVAQAVFAGDTPSADAALAYAEHLATRDDPTPQRRVLVASVELWPEHEGIREAAQRFAEEELTRARAERQGPLYDEAGGDEEG